MKKIPTLFKRVFTPDHKKTITQEVTPGCEWVLRGEGLATVKYDGACCAIIDGEIWKRYDAKQKYGKKPPAGAIPCQPEPDAITGHWPHWVKCEEWKPEDKYFIEAYKRCMVELTLTIPLLKSAFPNKDIWTCEAIGPHWQSNPYGMKEDRIYLHGMDIISWDRIKGDYGEVSFQSIRSFLSNDENCGLPLPWFGKKVKGMEGIVFWKDGEPRCKIKRSDFGFEWPVKK